MSVYNRQISLGIEGSANKIGVGIVTFDGHILANIRKTYIPSPGSGFLPRETAKHHAKYVLDLIHEALEVAKIASPRREITLLCYTKGPGMAGPLSVGATVVRTLSQLWGKETLHTPQHEPNSPGIKHTPQAGEPFENVHDLRSFGLLPVVGVNHCVAHIEMGRLICEARDPVVLYASGGNTQVIVYRRGKYHILGETLDLAVGNCIDRFARLLGLSNDPSPGYSFERFASQKIPPRKVNTDPDSPRRNDIKLIPLPYGVKGMDMSFSGILSYAQRLFNHPKNQDASNNPPMFLKKKCRTQISCRVDPETEKSSHDVEIAFPFDNVDLCYSFQETIFAVLVETTERVMSYCDAKEVLIVGGVGCNLRLQEMMRIMVASRQAAFSDVDNSRGGEPCKVHGMDERYCVDNGSMIAHTGALEYRSYEARSKAGCSAAEMKQHGSNTEEETEIKAMLQRMTVSQRFRTDDVFVTWLGHDFSHFEGISLLSPSSHDIT